MKLLSSLFAISLIFSAQAQTVGASREQMQSLQKQIDALLEAFANGDAARVAALHHPNIIKYFGGNQVVTGRAELERGLVGWFRTTKVEFVEDSVESTVFNGETAIQVCIFAIKATPKSGGAPDEKKRR